MRPKELEITPFANKTQTVRQVGVALAAGDKLQASEIARSDYPFAPQTTGKRVFSALQTTSVFLRDGFVDRYSGTELVFPGVLRLLSRLLPEEFPAHPNRKMTESHIVDYALFPTIDHVLPIARGGSNHADHWGTTSMVLNSAKANFTLDELRWTLLPPGDPARWDGLLHCFLEIISHSPEHLADNYVKT